MIPPNDPVYLDPAGADDSCCLFGRSGVSQNLSDDDYEWDAFFSRMGTGSRIRRPRSFLALYRPESWCWFAFELSGSSLACHCLIFHHPCFLVEESAPP